MFIFSANFIKSHIKYQNTFISKCVNVGGYSEIVWQRTNKYSSDHYKQDTFHP